MTLENKTLSERIKEIRASFGLTQTQLAEKVGITQRQIAKYEAGESAPRDIVLSKLSAALGVSKEYLLHGAEEYGANGRLPLLTQLELIHFGKSYIAPSEYAEIILPNRKNAFAYRHVGDSLEPYYEEGEFLIIDPVEQVERFTTGKRSLYLIMFGGEARVRHVDFANNGNITIWTPNRNYPPTTFHQDDAKDLLIIVGRVIGSIQ